MEYGSAVLRTFALQHGMKDEGNRPSKEYIARETVRRGLEDKLPALDRRLHHDRECHAMASVC